MVRRWLPVEDIPQECAQVAFCAALKADQPAERLLGSKRLCRIELELSVGSDVEMARPWPEHHLENVSPEIRGCPGPGSRAPEFSGTLGCRTRSFSR